MVNKPEPLCVPCTSAGQQIVNGNSCKCGPGYAQKESSEECLPCARVANTNQCEYDSATGHLVPLAVKDACAMGYARNSTTDQCTNCEKNYFKMSNGDCILCDGVGHSKDVQRGSCVCQVGFRHEAGTIKCEPCGSGETTHDGRNICRKCDADKGTCEACTTGWTLGNGDKCGCHNGKGYYQFDGEPKCRQCSTVGHMRNFTNPNQCICDTSIAPGWVLINNACVQCQANNCKACATESDAKCKDNSCLTGWKMNPPNKECNLCDAPSYLKMTHTVTEQVHCVRCPQEAGANGLQRSQDSQTCGCKEGFIQEGLGCKEKTCNAQNCNICKADEPTKCQTCASFYAPGSGEDEHKCTKCHGSSYLMFNNFYVKPLCVPCNSTGHQKVDHATPPSCKCAPGYAQKESSEVCLPCAGVENSNQCVYNAATGKLQPLVVADGCDTGYVRNSISNECTSCSDNYFKMSNGECILCDGVGHSKHLDGGIRTCACQDGVQDQARRHFLRAVRGRDYV